MRAVQPKDPLFDVITSKMVSTTLHLASLTSTMLTLVLQSTQEMFECLVKHGCVDMSSSLDTSRRSITVIASGGFGDVWQVNTTDGSLVAVKTLRLQTFLQGNDKGAKVSTILLFREFLIWVIILIQSSVRCAKCITGRSYGILTFKNCWV